MEKKKRLGIRVFGTIFILIGIIVGLSFVLNTLSFLKELVYAKSMIERPYQPGKLLPGVIGSLSIAIAFFLIGVGIIRTKRWALIAMFILLAITSPAVLGLLLGGVVVGGSGAHLLGYALMSAGCLYFLFIVSIFIDRSLRRLWPVSTEVNTGQETDHGSTYGDQADKADRSGGFGISSSARMYIIL